MAAMILLIWIQLIVHPKMNWAQSEWQESHLRGTHRLQVNGWLCGYQIFGGDTKSVYSGEPTNLHVIPRSERPNQLASATNKLSKTNQEYST